VWRQCFRAAEFFVATETICSRENRVCRKEQNLTENLRKNGLAADNIHILLVTYKAEKQLEIYAKKKDETIYKLIDIYDICASSGELGPKRRQGDGQVPEGFYKIARFNPAREARRIDFPIKL
jgi:murein L,D-transpeptidase YafK